MIFQLIVTFILFYIGFKVFYYFYVGKLVNDFTSGSIPKIISASLSVREMYNSKRLYEISKYMNAIEDKTKYIELGSAQSGGYLDINYAIEKLKYIKFNSSGCLCRTYPYDYKFNFSHHLKLDRIEELKKQITVGIRHFKLIKCTKCQEIYRCAIKESDEIFSNINFHERLKEELDYKTVPDSDIVLRSDAILRVLESKNTKAIDKMAELIHQCRDVEILKELSNDIAKYLASFASVYYDENDICLKSNCNAAFDVLNEIQFGNCYCKSYAKRGCGPEYLQKIGKILIESKKNDVKNHEQIFECLCSTCGKRFDVICFESGHFWAYKWIFCK